MNMKSAQDVAVPEGWRLVRVNEHFDTLISALERAESKGYLPNALAEEWANFACDENIAAAPQAPVATQSISEELEAHRQMLADACGDLGAIHEALGLDPDEAGGPAPILEAIAELKRERDQWVDANYAAPTQQPARASEAGETESELAADARIVHVDKQGVRFGKHLWLSHEKITGRNAEELNAGKGPSVKGYIEWLSSAPAQQAAPLTDAARDVLAERRRQLEQEGWTPEHDDEYDMGEMAHAAAWYSVEPMMRYALDERGLGFWPWADEWWKPTTPRRDLVKAGALILAEIERLDRAALQSQGEAS